MCTKDHVYDELVPFNLKVQMHSWVAVTLLTYFKVAACLERQTIIKCGCCFFFWVNPELRFLIGHYLSQGFSAFSSMWPI